MYRLYTVTILLFIIFNCCFDNLFAQQGYETSQNAEASYLKIKSNLDTFYLVVDNQFQSAKTLGSGDSLAISPGKHRFRMVNKKIIDREFVIDIPEYTSISKTVIFEFFYDNVLKSSYRRIENKGNLEIITDRNTQIHLDGNYYGSGFALIDTLTGDYKLELKHPQHGILSKNISIETPYEIVSYERYHKKQIRMSIFDRLIPGKAQIKQGQYKRGLAVILALATSSTVTVLFNNSFNDANDELQSTIEQYNNATTSQEAIILRQRANRQFPAVKNKEQVRNNILMVTAGIYTLSLLDTFLKPRNGYPAPRKRIQAQPSFSTQGISLNFRISL